jgi:hypothetical protein
MNIAVLILLLSLFIENIHRKLKVPTSEREGKLSNPRGCAARARRMEKKYGNLWKPALVRRAGAMHLFFANHRYSTTSTRVVPAVYCRVDWNGTGASDPRGCCARDFVNFREKKFMHRARAARPRGFEGTTTGSWTGSDHDRTLHPLVLGRIIENQHSDFVTP